MHCRNCGCVCKTLAAYIWELASCGQMNHRLSGHRLSLRNSSARLRLSAACIASPRGYVGDRTADCPQSFMPIAVPRKGFHCCHRTRRPGTTVAFSVTIPYQNDECGSIFPIGAIFASRAGRAAQKEELGHTPGCLADAARTTRVP